VALDPSTTRTILFQTIRSAVSPLAASEFSRWELLATDRFSFRNTVSSVASAQMIIGQTQICNLFLLLLFDCWLLSSPRFHSDEADLDASVIKCVEAAHENATKSTHHNFLFVTVDGGPI
jgi:hypothetical protein